MSAAGLLHELERLGVELRLSEGRIQVSAPAGVLTPAHREQLREHKADLVRLLDNPAALIAQQAAIIPIKPGTGTSPIYGVPGHNGDVFCYRGLASCIGADRPLYGLQPPGLDGHSRPMVRVEDVASYFAAQILASHPKGPVVIAGYCAGGSVALDLTRQLRQAGQDVGVLVLMGTPYPASYRKWRFRTICFREYLYRICMDWRRLSKLMDPAHLRRAIQWLRPEVLTSEVNEGLPPEQAAMQQAVQRATCDAAASYEPVPIDVPVIQFLPNRRWRHMGIGHDRWRRLATDYCEFVGPDQVAQDSMLRLPHVRLIAGALEGRIAYLSEKPVG